MRAIAAFTLISFLSQQCLFAQQASQPEPVQQSESGQYTPVITPEQYEARQKEQSASGQINLDTDDHFLNSEEPLKPTEENYEARQTVEEVSDLLREDFAYAAVLKNLNEQDIRTLLDADVEVGLIVVDGEIVIFTSGSGDEIRTAAAAQDLFEQASLIAHTHPREEQSTGPSGKDIDMARGTEYVITEAGVYVYDSTGVKGRITYDKFIAKIPLSRGVAPEATGCVNTRNLLNQFIADTDALNSARESGTLFRAGGTVNYNPALTHEDVSTLAGKPDPILTGGSSAGSHFTQAGAEIGAISYEVTQAGTYAGVTFNFDNFGTAPFEFADLSALTKWVFGIATDADRVFLEIEDADGDRDALTLINTVPDERIYEVDPALIASAVDRSRIRLINFVVKNGFISNGNLTGNLSVHARGLAPSFVNQSALVDSNSFSDMAGFPRRMKTLSSSAGTSTTIIDSQNMNLHYDVTAANAYSGFTLAYDDFGTAPIENFDLSLKPVMAMGLQGDTEKVRLEIQDASGRRVNLSLEGISAGTEKFYKIDFSQLAFNLDLKRIAFINFVEDRFTVGAAPKTGNLKIRYGTFVPDVTPPLVVATSAALTNNSNYTLTYTVDGTLQSENVILSEGLNTLHREFLDPSGNRTAMDFLVTLDTIPPPVVATSVALTNNSNYVLTYTVDGIAKSKNFTLTEGLNSLSVTDQDLAGNVSTVSFDVTLDTVAPVTLFVSAALTKNPNYTLVYTNDGAQISESIILTEGDNTITRIVTDPAGNQTQLSAHVTLDSVAPSLDLVSPVLVNQANYTLEYKIDGVAKTESIVLTEGANVITRTGQDLAGNETTAAWVVTLDSVPPQIAFHSAPLTNHPNYTLEYYSDGVLFTSSVTLSEGENTIPVIQRDLAGNETRMDYKVTLDTIASQIIFTSGTLTNQPFYALTYTVDGQNHSETLPLLEGENVITRSFTDPAGNSSNETMRVTLDTIAPQVVATSAALTNNPNYTLTYTEDGIAKSEPVTLVEGNNILTRQFQDTAGNSVTKNFVITLDTIAPLVVATSVALTNNPNYTLSYTSDGWTILQSMTLIEGENIIPIVERDAAGNETQVDYKVTLDTIAPLVVATSAALTNNPSYTLKYLSDGVPKTIPLQLTEGNNIIPIVERDAAGNETRQNFTVTLDTIPPRIVATSVALTNNPNYTLEYTEDGVAKSESIVLTEGMNTVHRQFQDAAGNQTSIDFSVTLDSIAPQIIFTSAALVNNSNYVLTYTADGVIKSSFQALSEGDNTFNIVERDVAGNETRSSITVTLDSIAPDIQFNSASLVKDPNYTLVYTVDGVQKTEPVTLIEGDNAFTRSETDLAGNTSSKNFHVTLDTIPPQVILKSQTLTNQTDYPLEYTVDGVFTMEMVTLIEGANVLQRNFVDVAGNSIDVTFSVTLDTKSPTVTLISWTLVNQPAYTLEYLVDGALVQEGTALSEGLNVFHREGQDAAGNRWSADFQIELDTVPPLVVAASAALTNNPSYLLTYTVDGISKSEPITLVEGENTLTRTETDAAGNSTTATFKVTLDTIAPLVVATSVALTNNSNYLLTYTTDGVLKSESITLAEGDNIFVRTETDAAGNSTTLSFTVTLDTIAPQIQFNSPPIVNQSAYPLAYTVDGISKSESVILVEGSNLFARTETDAAGNSTTASFTVTLDTIAPQIQFTSSALVNQPLYSLTYTADGQPVTRSVFLTEGDNAIPVTERDAAGNQTQTFLTVTLDTVAPLVVAASAALTNNPNYTLQYISDGISKSTAQNLQEGSNALTVVERDAAGNETRLNFTVTLDTIPPLVVAASATLTNNFNYLLQYTVDGSIRVISHTLTEGVNHLPITETDAAGNTSSKIFDVTLDTIAPALLITSPTRVVDAAPSIPYTLEYSVDGAVQQEPVTLVQGPNLFTRHAHDAAGNSRAVTFTVLLDTPPPANPEPPQVFLGVFTLPGTETLPELNITQPAPDPDDTFVLKDGSVLSDFEFDANGELEDFTRTLSFGAVQTVENGILKTQKNIDGTVYQFNAFGGVMQVLLPDGSVLVVIQTSADGKIIHYWMERLSGEKIEVDHDRVVRSVDVDGTVKVYDADGVLVRIEKSDGQIWSDLGFSIDGSLTQLTKQLVDGMHLIGDQNITNREVAPDGTLRIFDPHTNYLIQILPDQTREEFIGERKLRETRADGTLIEYNSANQIQRVVDADGSEIRYLEDGRIQVLTPNKEMISAVENLDVSKSQSPFSILLGNGIRAAYADESISELVFPNGVKVLNPQFSETLELTGGLLIHPSGIKDTVIDGNVIRREFSSNLVLDFAPDGKLVRILKDNELVEQASLSQLVGESVLQMVHETLEQGKIELADQSFLELNRGVIERQTQNGMIQQFTDGKLSGIKMQDGTEYVSVSESEFRLKSIDLGSNAKAYFNETGFEKLEFGDGRVLNHLEDLDLAVMGAKLLRDGRYSIQKDAYTYFYDSEGNLSEILNDDRKFTVSDGKIQQLEIGKSVISYDANGALDAITLASGEKYRFDRAGNLFQVVTESGNKIIYQGSKVSSFVDESGTKIRLYREFNTRTQTEEIYVTDDIGEPSHKRGLISYLLRDMDSRKKAFLVTELADMFDITNSLGAFHTPPDKAVEIFDTDPDRGSVSRLDYQVSQGNWMGLYAKTPNVDISQYEYISVGLKGTPGPVKIELKGTGQTFELNLTGEWQDFVLPVKGRSGEITEITVIVNEPVEGPAVPRSGYVLLDHMAFFNPKLEEKPDWQAEAGITAGEINNFYQSASQIPAAKLPILDAAMTSKLAGTPVRLKYDADGKLADLAFITPPKPLEVTDEKITTHYEYDEFGALKSAKLDYQGQSLGNFEYKQEEGTTVVKGDDGVARRYDQDGVLTGVINPDGTEYQMGYDGNALKLVNLKRQYLDGAIRNYADGKLSSIDLADGSSLTQITFGDDGGIKSGVMTKPDGTIYVIENGFPKEIRYPSGTVKPFDLSSGELIGWQKSTAFGGEISLFVMKQGEEYLKYDESGILRQVVTESGENLFITPGKDRAAVTYSVPKEVDGMKIPAKEIISFDSTSDGISMHLGDTEIFKNEKNLILMVTDPASGKIVDQGQFDLSQDGAAMQLALFLRSVPENAFLVGSYGGGKITFPSDLEKYLVSVSFSKFGLTGFDSLNAEGGRWTFIGRNGAVPGKALEAFSADTRNFHFQSHTQTQGVLQMENGKLAPGTLGFDPEFLGQTALRADKLSDGMTPLATLSNGLVTAYQKNFVSTDPNSGFFRVDPQVDDPSKWNDPAFVNRMVDSMLNMVATRSEVYVYFDGRYPSNWISEEATIKLKTALAQKGIRVIDADQLAQLIKSNPKAAVIMAQDIAPDTVFDPQKQNYLVRDYLEAGGTMVWMHDIPFYYVGHAGINSKTEVGRWGQEQVLNVAAGGARVNPNWNYTDSPGYKAWLAAGAPSGVTIQLYASGVTYDEFMENPIPNSAQIKLTGDILQRALSVSYPLAPLQLWSKFEGVMAASPLDPSTAIVTNMDVDGKPSMVIRADGSSVSYDRGQIQKVVGADGTVEMEYGYASDGSIARIYLNSESGKISGEIDKQRVFIEKQRDAMISLLPDQEAYLIRKIDEEIAAQDAFLAQKQNELEAMRYQTIKQKSGGFFGIGAKTKTVRVEVPGVASAIAQVQQARVQLREQGEKAKADVKAEIETARTKILEDSAKSIALLPEKEKELRAALFVEEMAPVVAQNYRELLGRDPTETEITSFLNASAGETGQSPVLDIASLRAELVSSQERREKVDRQEQVTNAVHDVLTHYVSGSAEERTAILASLGLTAGINLNETEVTNIIAWLKSVNLHFGESAYGPLAQLLQSVIPAEAGIQVNDLARETILIDILTGVINPTTSGELTLSLNALNIAANLHGLVTTGQKISTDDLPSSEFIAFVNENHFILVKSIKDGMVTYFDQSIGEQGSLITLSLDQFKEIYSGVILTAEKVKDVSQLMSEKEMKEIRGSFIFLIIAGIAGAVAAAASAVVATAMAVVAAIGSVLAAVGSVISGFVSSIGGMLSGLASSIGGTISSGSAISGLTTLGQISGAISLASFGGQMVAQAFGAEGLARVLGTVSQISGVASFATTGIAGLANVFKGGFQAGLTNIATSIKNMGGKILNGITSIANTTGNLITGAGNFFGNILSGVGNFAGNVIGSLTNGGFLEGLKSIGTGIGKTFDLIGQGIVKGMDFLGKGIDWAGNKIGNLFSGSLGNTATGTTQKLSQSVYNNLVSVAVGNAVGKTLDGIGVDGPVARLITAFATGGYVDPTNFVGGSLRNLAMQGVSEAALKLDLPPPIAEALSTVTGLISGNLLDPQAVSIFSNFDKITPDLFSQGLTYLGTELGLSPTVSALIAGPVGGGLGAIVAGTATNQNTQAILKNMSQEFTSGLAAAGTSIAVTKVFDAIDAPPVAENMVKNLLTSIISNFFRTETGREPTAEEAEAETNQIFDKLGEGLKRFGQGVKTAVGTVMSFGQKVVEGVGHVTALGFKNAIGVFSSAFSPATQESIYQNKGTVTTADNGILQYKVGNTTLIEYDPAKSSVIEFGQQGSYAKLLGLGIDEGNNLIFDEAEYMSFIRSGAKVTQTFKAGRIDNLNVTSLEGQPYFEIAMPKDQSFEVEAYKLEDAQVRMFLPPSIYYPPMTFDFTFLDGRLAESTVTQSLENYIYQQNSISNDKDLYVLVNGILNDKLASSPLYLSNLRDDIVSQSDQKVSLDDIILAPTYFSSIILTLLETAKDAKDYASLISALFSPSAPILLAGLAAKMYMDDQGDQAKAKAINALKDALNFLDEISDPNNPSLIGRQIKNSMEKYFAENGNENRARNMIGVAHSGGFLPLAEVLKNNPYNAQTQTGYNATALVGLGAANLNLNEMLQNIIEKAAFLGDVIKMVQAGENQVIDAIEEGLKEILLMVKSANFLPIPDDLVTKTVELLRAGSSLEASNYFNGKISEWLHELAKTDFNLVKPLDLSSLKNMKLLVNVYGDQDTLGEWDVADVTVGGFKEEIGGFTQGDRNKQLINVELAGVTHIEYMRREDLMVTSTTGLWGGIWGVLLDAVHNVTTAKDREWNTKVANFVADMIGHSQDRGRLQDFLEQKKSEGIARKEDEKWIIELPGYQERK